MPSPGCFGLGPGTGSQRDSSLQAKRRWKGLLSEGSNPGAFQNRRNSYNTPLFHSGSPIYSPALLAENQQHVFTYAPWQRSKKGKIPFLSPSFRSSATRFSCWSWPEPSRSREARRGGGDLASTRSSPTTHRGSATNSRFPALAFPWADHRLCPPELTSVEAARKCRAHFGRWDPWG